MERRMSAASSAQPMRWMQVDKAYIEKCQQMLDTILQLETDPVEQAKKIKLLKAYMGHVIDLNMVGIEEQQGNRKPADVEITIGGTINIQNFENIRLEVRGTNINQLFETLYLLGDSLARNDPVTRDMVTHYFNRAFNDGLPEEVIDVPQHTGEVANAESHTA